MIAIEPEVVTERQITVRKALDYIAEDPCRLNMHRWLESDNSCGTVCCFAGAIQIVTGILGHTYIVARDALSLTNKQANRLFYPSSWPRSFFVAYENAETPEERFEALRERVRFFDVNGY